MNELIRQCKMAWNRGFQLGVITGGLICSVFMALGALVISIIIQTTPISKTVHTIDVIG